MKKLHLGSGENYFKGWINIDLDSKKADLNIDLTKKLPFKNKSVDYIYSEHFIEHIEVEEAVKLLKECYRILKKNGKIRFATPDLNYIVFRYFFFWKKQDWIKKYGYSHLKTKAEMLNLSFREWGHKYLYNYEELERRFKEAGFKKSERQKLNKSNYKTFKKLESRNDSRLIIEAYKG